MTKTERALAALIDARGEIVSNFELVEAMHPPGVERSASAAKMHQGIISKLRSFGYDVLLHPGLGYSLPVASVPKKSLLPPRRNRWDGYKKQSRCRRSAASLVAETQGGLCAVCGEAGHRLRLCNPSHGRARPRAVCSHCEVVLGMVFDPKIRQVLSMMERGR